MADMEARVALNYLLDFYGPLLTPNRQELMRLYCEEDLSQQEIAEQLNITRQGVSDAIAKSKKQLTDYERKLGLVARHREQEAAAAECLRALNRLTPATADAESLAEARRALRRVFKDI